MQDRPGSAASRTLVTRMKTALVGGVAIDVAGVPVRLLPEELTC